MTALKRTFTVVLAIFMVFSCLGIHSFAATVQTVKQYSSYLALGDSATRGNCASDGTQEYVGSNDFSSNIIPYSYVDIVSKAVLGESRVICSDDVEKANTWNCAFPALTLSGTLALLGLNNGEWDPEYSLSVKWDSYGFSPDARYDYALEYFGDREISYLPEDMTEYYEHHDSNIGLYGSLANIIAEADLITINLGMGDVFYRAVCLTLGNLFRGAAIDIAEVPKLPFYVEEGYLNWVKYYPVLLSYIHEVNPDATVVLAGTMNMMFNARITEDMVVPIGDLGSLYSAKMNNMLKLWAQVYKQEGMNISFADTSNVETGCTEYDWSLAEHIIGADYEPFTHPTRNGQMQIANSVLNVLPTAEKADDAENKKTDICIDLGRFDSVDTVKVNGITVNPEKYEMDGKTLIVHYGMINGINLSVYVGNGDDTTTMMTYQLSYDVFNGYSAYRMYSTNNVEDVRYKVSLVGIIERLVSLIKSLFGIS